MPKLIISSVAGTVPDTTQLTVEQIGVNTADGILYANNGSSIISIALYTVGEVKQCLSTVPLKGYIEIAGQSASGLRTMGFPKLADMFPGGLPDTRGKAVRGLDNGRGVDINRVVGSHQNQSVQPLTFVGNPLPDHNHGVPMTRKTGWGRTLAGNGENHGNFNTTGNSAGTPTGSITGTGTETVMANIAMMWMIRHD